MANNPQRKPPTSAANSSPTQFTAATQCGDDPCFNTIIDQLNESVAPLVTIFGGGAGGIGDVLGCAKSTYESYTLRGSEWELFATSAMLSPGRAFEQLGVIPDDTYGQPGGGNIAHFFCGVRDLPNSTDGQFAVWDLQANPGDYSPSTIIGELSTPTLRGAAASGPMISSPDGRYVALSRLRVGNPAEHNLVIMGITNSDPYIAGGVQLPGTINGPAEGIWLNTNYIMLPTNKSDNLLYIINASNINNVYVQGTITSDDTDLDTIRSLRVSYDGRTMYASGDGGVAAFAINVPFEPVQTSVVTTPTLNWESMSYHRTAREDDNFLFAARLESTTEIFYRTIDIDPEDSREITLNTADIITGTFPIASWGPIRGMRSPFVDVERLKVGGMSIPANQSDATFVEFDLSDRTSVTISDTITVDGVDSQAEYAIGNQVKETRPDLAYAIFFQKGLDAIVDSFVAPTSVTKRCTVQLDHAVISERPGGLGTNAGDPVSYFIIPASWAEYVVPNLNADMVDNMHASEIINSAVAIAVADAVGQDPLNSWYFGDVT